MSRSWLDLVSALAAGLYVAVCSDDSAVPTIPGETAGAVTVRAGLNDPDDLTIAVTE